MRQICALASVLLGNVSGADNETVPTTAAAPTPTSAGIPTYSLPSVAGAMLLITLYTLFDILS
jgi:hypothetical protein